MSMENIPESDWKYLRTIKDEMLEALCKRINDEASQIVSNKQLSQHERFLHLFRHVMQENEIIARCFDDWRRSNIIMNMLWLRKEQLLTDAHLSHLSEETRRRIDQV